VNISALVALTRGTNFLKILAHAIPELQSQMNRWQSDYNLKIKRPATGYSTKDINLTRVANMIPYYAAMKIARVFPVQKKNKAANELNKLIFISQFISDIHLIASKDNLISDCLSKMCSNLYFGSTIDYNRLFNEQHKDALISKLKPSDYFKKICKTVNNIIQYY
jgi:hypothetical protein